MGLKSIYEVGIMNIYKAAGYDEKSFAEVQRIVTDVVGTGNTLESIVRKGAETLDRDSTTAPQRP